MLKRLHKKKTIEEGKKFAAKQEATRKEKQAIAEAKAKQRQIEIRKDISDNQAEKDAREAEKEQTRAQKEKYTRDEDFEGKTGYRRAKGGIIERPRKKMKRGGIVSKK